MNRILLILTAACLLISYNLHSQNNDRPLFEADEEPVKLEPVYLPSKNLQMLDFEFNESTEDGLVHKEIKLVGKDLVLTTIPLKNWTHQSSTPWNCSLLLKYRYDPSTSIEVSVFSSNRIGGELDVDTAHRLLAGVENSQKRELKLFIEHSDIRPNGYLGNLLGNASFLFDYQYLSEKQDLVRKQMFLLSYKDKIITVTLSGPADSIDNHKQSLLMFVHNLSVSDL